MIKFVDMTPALRAGDPSAPPTCAFLNTETGRFCEHGGTGEHLFTSADDVAQHGPPGTVTMPAGFFAPSLTVKWGQVPVMALVRDDDGDGDFAVKHPHGGVEWVSINNKTRRWWPVKGPDYQIREDDTSVDYTIVATGLRGDETVAELQALAGADGASE